MIKYDIWRNKNKYEEVMKIIRIKFEDVESQIFNYALDFDAVRVDLKVSIN